MGEVYQARDTKLNRDVALKVLPAAVANDPERLARFQREAHVLASLNHPNIAHVHGLEDSGQTAALVMELVSGPTLADRVVLGGRLPLAETLAIARQIADALEEAHAHHIIHRDLKPANVKVREDGTVKVLDFGLAKVLTSATTGVDSATIAVLNTQDGLVRGTPPYMSPEQARGGTVDERTDIWAFGCVLYEMLTGQRSFDGDSMAQVLVAVLEREPNWEAVAWAPSPLRRLVRRCLQKDPRRRLRHIADARLDLEEAQSGADESQPVVPVAPRRRWWPMPVGGFVLGVAAALAYGLVSRPGPASGVGETSGNARAKVSSENVTDAVGLEEFPAISPDDKTVAFTAFSGRRRQIWVRVLKGGTARQITFGDRDQDQPRWAPDSTTILYFSHAESSGEQGALYQISSDGGQSRWIANALGGADVSHDGQRIVAFQLIDKVPRLVVLGRDGAFVRELMRFSELVGGKTPRWAPDDRSVAYISGDPAFQLGIRVVAASGGEPRKFPAESFIRGLTWTPDGSSLIYGSPEGSTILYPPTFHLRLLRLADGESAQLTFGNDAYTDPDVSSSGMLLATRTEIHSALWKIPTTGRSVENARAAEQLTRQTSQVQTPSSNPDGTQVVYLSDSGGHGNLWITDARGRDRPRQITFEIDPSVSIGVPLWSSGGSQLVHIKRSSGRTQQWLVKPDGTGPRQLLDGAVAVRWSADGDWLYYTIADTWCIEKMRVSDRTKQPIRCGNSVAPIPRRDGTLFFQSVRPAADAGSHYELRKAYPEGGESTLLLPIDGRRLPYTSLLAVPTELSPDGRWLAYVVMDGATANVWKISTDGGQPQRITDFGDRALWIVRQITWPDNRFLYAAIADLDADIVSLSGLVSARAK